MTLILPMKNGNKAASPATHLRRQRLRETSTLANISRRWRNRQAGIQPFVRRRRSDPFIVIDIVLNIDETSWCSSVVHSNRTWHPFQRDYHQFSHIQLRHGKNNRIISYCAIAATSPRKVGGRMLQRQCSTRATVTSPKNQYMQSVSNSILLKCHISILHSMRPCHSISVSA